MKKTAKELDVVIEGWLEEHRKKMNSTQHVDEREEEEEAFMSALLSRVKELKKDLFGFSTDAIVKATCLVLFIGNP